MACSLGAIRERPPSMLIRLNHKVHVLFRRQDIDMVKLEGKVVVVLDILFATTTMVTALGNGAASDSHFERGGCTRGRTQTGERIVRALGRAVRRADRRLRLADAAGAGRA